jgi:hypothetical protein
LGWKLSCYIDADDPELAPNKSNTVEADRALAERIRSKLRDCRCIIYAYSMQSLSSRWMPWELGFFDGRWGPRQIGLYNLDEGHASAHNRSQESAAHRSGVLEYLRIYEELNPDNLRAFLLRACSTRALADRADVDVDRVATLLAGMSRDPVNFALDAWFYLITLQQQFWSRFPGGVASGFSGPGVQPPAALWGDVIRAGENLHGLLEPLAAALRPPVGMQHASEAQTAAFRKDAEQALKVSR